METLKLFLNWLFPNGIGTRAILAFIVVGAAVAVLAPDALKDLTFLVVGFYFGSRANGNGKPKPPQE